MHTAIDPLNKFAIEIRMYENVMRKSKGNGVAQILEFSHTDWAYMRGNLSMKQCVNSIELE